MMEQLKACYEKYITEAEQVWKDRPAWDGVFGLKSSVKDHRCHTAFLKTVEAWVEDFVKSDPTSRQAEEAVTYVLEAAEPFRDTFHFWTIYAAHGLVRPLIPMVSPQYAARMRVWYNDHYPRKDRLPVHKDLFKLLKKQERV